MPSHSSGRPRPGMPTTANYVVVATLMAPVLVEVAQQNDLAVPLVAVHMEVDGRDVAVPVTLYAPVDKTDHWCCEFEIAWPDKPKLGKGNGLDAVQALLIALEMVGINLYSSDAHKQGKLKLDGRR